MRVDSNKTKAVLDELQRIPSIKGDCGRVNQSDNGCEDNSRRPRKCGPYKHVKKPRRSKREKQAERYGSYKDLLNDTYKWMRRR